MSNTNIYNSYNLDPTTDSRRQSYQPFIPDLYEGMEERSINRLIRSSGSSYSTRMRVTKIEDADTVYVKYEGPTQTFLTPQGSITLQEGSTRSVRVSGIDAPETTHSPLTQIGRLLREGNTNPIQYINAFRNQDYGREATNIAKEYISEGSLVQVDFRREAIDKNGRYLADIINEEGISLSRALIARGAVHAYFPRNIGNTNTQYHDPEVLTPDLMRLALANIVQGKGLYANPNYSNPLLFKNGALELPGTSLKKDLSVVRSFLLQESGISANVAETFSDPDRGVLIQSNLGPSYFYARSLYNNAMRGVGHGERAMSSDDISLATSMYKMAMVIKTGSVPNLATSEASVFQQYDKELETAGLGALFNEHIAMKLGWGRLYKDEYGFVPSLLGAFGAVLDRSFLFYTASNDIPGINTLIDSWSPKDQGYKSGDTKPGLFESLLSAGTSHLLTTASAVSLYLTIGEPISLLISEMAKENYEQMINTALPSTPKGINNFNSPFNFLVRQASLGIGVSSPDPMSLKASVLLDIAAAEKRGGSYYDTNNFKLSPYHAEGLFRKRAQHLLTGIMKPFLIDIVNPYMDGHDKAFIHSIDNLVEEVGSPVRLVANFSANESFNILSNLEDPHHQNTLFNARNHAISKYDSAYKTSKSLIARSERMIDKNSRRIDQLLDGSIDDVERSRLMRATGSIDNDDLIKKLRHRNEVLNIRAGNARTWQEAYSLTSFFNHIAGIDNNPIGLLDSKGNKINTQRFELGAAISSVQFVIQNAGEDRQIRVARALQGVLDQVPLNPFRWRVFSAFNGGLLKAHTDGTKAYRAIGDIFSFEAATQVMRNLILGTGGVTDLLTRYEVYSNKSSMSNIGRVSKGLTDRIHTFWNLVVQSPTDAIEALRKRKRVVDGLRKSTEAFKAMEFTLASQNSPSSKFITYADDINGAELQKLLSTLREEGERLGYSGRQLDEYIDNQAYKEGRLGSHLDAFSREIGSFVDIAGEDLFFKAIVTLSEPVREATLAGDDAALTIASQASTARARSLGIMSLTSTSTLNKRLNNLKVDSDPASKLSKSKLFTYVATAIAITSTLDSLFKSSSGVSLFTQLRTSLTAGGWNSTGEDLGFNVEFSGEAGFLPTSGSTSRLATGVVIHAATLWGAKWAAESMQDIDSISYSFRGGVLARYLGDDLQLIHTATNTLVSGEDLATFSGSGTFRLQGNKFGVDIGMDLVREAGDEGLQSLFKFNHTRLTGNVWRNTAIVYTLLSGSMWGASKLAASMLNSAREGSGSLDPVLFSVGGAVVGARAFRNFGAGLLGFLAGGLVGTISSAMGMKLAPLGQDGPVANSMNMQLATELETFKNLIRSRGLANASKEELMASIYAGKYAEVLNLINEGGNKFTQVVAKQSPLPFLQFFLSESTELRNGQRGQTYYSIGIQSAPILGMNFSVGLPVKYTPGAGLFGLVYNEKNNLLDNYGNLQGFLVSSYIGLYSAKALLSGANSITKMLGMNWELGHKGSINTLLKLTSTIADIGDELFIGTPTRVLQYMYGSDLYLGYKIGPQMFSKKTYGTKALEAGNTMQAASIKKSQLATAVLGRAFVGGVMGWMFGSLLGALQGKEGGDALTTSALWSVGAAGAHALYHSRVLIAPMGGQVITRYAKSLSNTLKTSPRIAIGYKKAEALTRSVGISLSKTKLPSALSKINRLKGNALPFAIAALASSVMTDNNFGIAVGMSNDNGQLDVQRALTVAMYSGVVGSIAVSLGAGRTYLDTIESWERINDAPTIENTKPSIIKRAKTVLGKFRNYFIEKDMDNILRTVRVENQRAASFLKEAPDAKDVQALAKAGRYLEDHSLNTAKSINNSQELGERLRTGSTSQEASQLLVDLKASRGAYISNRTFATRMKSTARGIGIAMTLPTIALTTVASMMGNGDMEGALTHMYRSLDNSDNIFLKSLADTIRLITFTDGAYKDNRSMEQVHRDDSSFTGGNSLVRYMKLVKPSNSKASKADELLKNAQSMFITNAPNPFISFLPAVGFTFRSGEYGTRTNSYIQLQTPGADISTSIYSMSASFMFKEALSGQYDQLFILKDTFHKINTELKGNAVNKNSIKRAAINLLSLTAHMPPLQKRRKFSVLDRRALDTIGADPLLAAVVRDRQNRSRHMSYQPVASIMSNMLIQGMDNNLLSNKGLLQKYIEGDASALKVLIDDPFGLISKQLVIGDVKVFTGIKQNRKSTNAEASDESDLINLSAMRLSNFDKPESNQLFDAINSSIGMVAGGTSWIPNAIKWPFFIGVGAMFSVGILHSLGTWSADQETTRLQNQVNDFYNETWYPTKEVQIGSQTKTVGTLTADVVRAPGGAVVHQHGRPKVFINKGANYWDVNQQVASPLITTNRLQSQLIELQRAINMTVAQFHTAPDTGRTISLAAYMTSEEQSTKMYKEVETLLAQPNLNDAKDKVVDGLLKHYEAISDQFVDSYIKSISSVYVDISNVPALRYLIDDHNLTDGKIKLISLLGGEHVDAETIVRMAQETDPDKAISMLKDAIKARGTGDIIGDSYSKTLKQVFRENIKATLIQEIKGRGFNGRVDLDDFLSSGASFDGVGSMEYLTQKVLFNLQSGTSSPMYLIRHSLGGIAHTMSTDVPGRIEYAIGKIIERMGGVSIRQPSERDISNTASPPTYKGASTNPQSRKGSPPKVVIAPSTASRGGSLIDSIPRMNSFELEYLIENLVKGSDFPSGLYIKSSDIELNRSKVVDFIDLLDNMQDDLEALRAVRDRFPPGSRPDIDKSIKALENHIKAREAQLNSIGVGRVEIAMGDTPGGITQPNPSLDPNNSVGRVTQDGYYYIDNTGNAQNLRPALYDPSPDQPINSRSPVPPQLVNTEPHKVGAPPVNNTPTKKGLLGRASASSLDIPETTSSSRTRVNARFKKGVGNLTKGAGRAFEILGFINDMVDVVSIVGAYSRFGDTYNSGRFTEAQRLNAANEAGNATVQIGLNTAFTAAVLNAGALSAAIGTGIAGISKGLIAVGGTKVAFGAAAIGASIVSAPAWVIGAAAAAIVGISLITTWCFLPEDKKKSLLKGLGDAKRSTEEFVGKGIKGLGDAGFSIGGGRIASGIMGAIGFGLAGAVVGLGLAASSVAALPVLATVATFAALSAGAGLLVGALFPSQMSSFTTAVINQMGQIPVIGGFLSSMLTAKPGSWLSQDKHLSQGPMFVGTASEAIKNEYAQHLSAAEDYTGSTSARLFTSDSMYGVPNSGSPLLVKGGDLSYLIRPGSMTDPLIDREIKIRAQLYNQTIIGRYLWRSMLEQSKDAPQIKRLDERYRHQRAQETVRAQKAVQESKALKNNAPGPSKRDPSNQSIVRATEIAIQLTQVAQTINKDTQANQQGLLINVIGNRVPPSAAINHHKDMGLVSRGSIKTTVVSTSQGRVTTQSSVDISAELASYAVRSPSTSTPD